MKRGFVVLAFVGLMALAACSAKLPNMDEVLDHPLIDRRIDETPRMRAVRECKAEVDRFRVDCRFCHQKDSEADIVAPDKLLLTDSGRRARIMRHSPTFGLHNQCSKCHLSKFNLNQYAQELFGPQSERFKEMQEELNAPVK